MGKNIDWDSLAFNYVETDCHIKYVCKDGVWGQQQVVDEPQIQMHISATALHYGQAAFEGLKAYACKDGKVRIFRSEENGRRIQLSGERSMMAKVPAEVFEEAVQAAVAKNIDYVPPYGTGGSLYIRPLLFGTGPQMGLAPSTEYTLIVFVAPVGAYYKAGIKAIDAIILEGFDRAAPQGVGHVKLAGNYAASLLPAKIAKDAGYPIGLYLDAKEHKYIDEFGTSNFIGITKDGTYVTPDSSSVLQSITNMSLMEVAKDMGIKVEKRPVEFSEIKDFVEVGACGTAVVISPIKRIVRGDEEIVINDLDGFGPVLERLYKRLIEIQYGEVEDKFGWTTVVN
jgi:branched-chain amino acid aminotransferase